MGNTGKKKTFTDKELRELRAEFLNAERERVREETEEFNRPTDGETSED